jgi:hypothetical protein
MNIRQSAQSLLTHFAPEERAIPDALAYPGRNAAVLEAMNGAMQEISGLNGPWVRWETRGVRLAAPRVVEISGTPTSTAVTIIGAVPPPRSSIAVQDAPMEDNAVASMPRTVNGAQVIDLLLPPRTSGMVTATVFSDAVALGDDVMSIHDPVIVGGVTIAASATPRGPVSVDDYGAHRELMTLPQHRPTVANAASRPTTYSTEWFSDDPSAAPSLILRLSPAPAAEMTATFRVKLRPVAMTTATSSEPVPVPMEFVQTIFLPIARQKLLGSAFFRDAARVDEIMRAYAAARELAARVSTAAHGGTFHLRH